MSVRKRAWTTAKGVAKEAWIVDYVDQHGDRHIKTFRLKREADDYEKTVGVAVLDGTHTAAAKSITVREAGMRWLAECERNGLERTTLAQYGQHLQLHIIPYLGGLKLSELSAPIVADFRVKLLDGVPAPGQSTSEAEKRSPALTKKVLVSFGSILSYAQAHTLVARNVVRDLRTSRRRGKDRQTERRHKRKLKIGVDIPTPAEIRAFIDALDPRSRWYPLFLMAVCTGLRASELRGLRWQDIDLARGTVHVTQRADAFNEIGSPKSESGERTIPLPRKLVAALREWKLLCPRLERELVYVFPNGNGGIENHANIVNRGLVPAFIAAGVTAPALDDQGKPIKDDSGKPVLTAKYTGMHALRHFYASWCINRPEDGGMGLPPKMVQEQLGHSTIMMTMDVYGHLFPRDENGAEIARAEAALFG